MSMLARLAATGGAAEKLYVDDVFSTYLYTGNGSTQTINNGIDLAGNGGLVWSKSRASAQSHFFIDSATGRSWGLSNATSAFTPPSGAPPGVISSFNSNGYTLGINSGVNLSGEANVSWTFRKAPKFFDCGTYTGSDSASRAIPHALGVTPGLVIVKRTDSSGNWFVMHWDGVTRRSLLLNATDAAFTSGSWFPQDSTSSNFFVASSSSFAAPDNAGHAFVWYALAHDTSAEGIIQCGSFTTDGSGNATVTLPWEPQFLTIKGSSFVVDWQIHDVMRGSSLTSYSRLFPNTSGAESTGTIPVFAPNATGFGVSNLAASQTYIYLAIRRPNKPPTTGTQVYNAIASSAATGTKLSAGFPVDLQIFSLRTGNGNKNQTYDRLRGISSNTIESGVRLLTNSSAAEISAGNESLLWDNDGFSMPSSYGGTTMVFWNFKRAPGVFDVVTYTGTGSARTVNHSLGAVPELIVVKERSNLGTFGWSVYAAPAGNGNRLVLNTTAASSANTWMNSTDPTASVFSLSTSSLGNQNTATYIAYLFASSPGISKVGSYTGNGSSQTIDCGFSAGARFVLIKRTDSTGDWYVWDSVRGIVAANDPHLSLNTTAAEVTSNDSIDPASAGFIVNQVAATNVNVNAATYIYLAYA